MITRNGLRPWTLNFPGDLSAYLQGQCGVDVMLVTLDSQ